MTGSRAGRVFVAAVLTTCAFVALLMVMTPVYFVPVSPVLRVVLAYSIPELGFAAIGACFLVLLGEDRSFVDLDRPNRMDGWWTAWGIVGVVAFNLFVQWTVTTLGGEPSTRFTPPDGTDPMLLLAGLSIVFLLVVGPTEEFFFRGVVQRYLDAVLTRRGAYAWTSLLFASTHLPGVASTGGGFTQYVTVGVVLFGFSWTLGWLYDRTRNILVPSIVHGGYNVIVFSLLVFDLLP